MPFYTQGNDSLIGPLSLKDYDPSMLTCIGLNKYTCLFGGTVFIIVIAVWYFIFTHIDKDYLKHFILLCALICIISAIGFTQKSYENNKELDSFRYKLEMSYDEVSSLYRTIHLGKYDFMRDKRLPLDSIERKSLERDLEAKSKEHGDLVARRLIIIEKSKLFKLAAILSLLILPVSLTLYWLNVVTIPGLPKNDAYVVKGINLRKNQPPKNVP